MSCPVLFAPAPPFPPLCARASSRWAWPPRGLRRACIWRVVGGRRREPMGELRPGRPARQRPALRVRAGGGPD
eukprot:8190207-Pyramimonas_sp.AAC.1